MKLKIKPKKIIQKRIPIFNWFPLYNKETWVSDLIAGITIGLTLIPQVIAYASLAGLGPQYGLYSAFAGSFIYIIFGTCPEINIGPTALLSLLTFTYTQGTDPRLAILLCFLTGCVELLFGILHLGTLIQFVSIPVTIGFTSASSIIIASSQVKGLLGLSFKAENFIETWQKLFRHIDEIKLGDTFLSVLCCSILLILKYINSFICIDDKNDKKYLEKLLWVINVGRNIIVVMLCTMLAYTCESNGISIFKLTGKVDSGLPEFKFPSIEIFYDNQEHNFLELLNHLGFGVVIMALIAILGNVAIAKAFSNGRTVDATQEMIALGFCNIFGSFFSSYPVCGSFSRSAVSNASGVKTPMAGLYTAILILLSLTFLTPYFYFIPKATLSSVIICAVLFLIEYTALKPMWNSNRLDLVTFLVTFFVCLIFGVEFGISIGVVTNLIFLLYKSARPKLKIENILNVNGISYILVTPMEGLLFPAIDNLRSVLLKLANDKNHLPIVFDCNNIQNIDYTVVKGFNGLVKDFLNIDRFIIFYKIDPNIEKILGKYGTNKFNVIHTLDELQKHIQNFNDTKQNNIQVISTVFSKNNENSESL